MKTSVHFLPYFAHAFLEGETLPTKVKKIKTRIWFSVNFFLKSCRL